MTLYEDLLHIAQNYLGPAAQDYLDRRIRIVQRGEDPLLVTPDRLERLAAGIEMTAKVYVSASRVPEFAQAVRDLARVHSK